MVQPVDPAELYGHSEQALIELIYVKVANEVLGSRMEELEKALTHAKNILSILTQLQNAKNQLHVTSRSVPAFDESNYETDASHIFGSPIVPSLIASFDYSVITGYAADLDQALNDLLNDLPGGAGGAEATALMNDSNSIYSLGKKVITDIGSDPEAWVMDKYNEDNTQTAGQAGLFQNNLTLAITAGQSLNDSKKEEVRRFLYIFEEYYKSASSILNKITQILEGVARNISRS